LNLQKTLAALTTKSSAFFCRGGRPKRSAPAFPRRAASLAHSLLQRRLTAFIGKLVRSDGHLGSDLMTAPTLFSPKSNGPNVDNQRQGGSLGLKR